MAVTDDSTKRLYDRLIARGVPADVAGDVSADLGDMTGGIEKIQDLFDQIAEGLAIDDALDRIESECRDHLLGHLKSIRTTAQKLRRLRKTLVRHPGDAR